MTQEPVALEGACKSLLADALRLMDHLELQDPTATWTFGGGTVLMLRYGHRKSKDIDLFIPDPQYLGLFSPRLSDLAADMAGAYDEGAEYVKLYLREGEIDVVACAALTSPVFQLTPLLGRQVRTETSAEILAKKMWHRGDHCKARDLFDLCAVAHFAPDAIQAAKPFLLRHRDAFLQKLETHRTILEAEFAAIEMLNFRPSLEDCVARARQLLG